MSSYVRGHVIMGAMSKQNTADITSNLSHDMCISSRMTPPAPPDNLTKFYTVLDWWHLGMLVGYETWYLLACHHPFVIGWSKYRLGLSQSQWAVCSSARWGFPPIFRRHWQSPWTALMEGKSLSLGPCKETVKRSNGLITPGNSRMNL